MKPIDGEFKNVKMEYVELTAVCGNGHLLDNFKSIWLHWDIFFLTLPYNYRLKKQ